MKCWFYTCVFGYDWYLEWDKRNTIEFGYEKEPKCFTLFVGIWRLIVSVGNCSSGKPT